MNTAILNWRICTSDNKVSMAAIVDNVIQFPQKWVCEDWISGLPILEMAHHSGLFQDKR